MSYPTFLDLMSRIVEINLSSPSNVHAHMNFGLWKHVEDIVLQVESRGLTSCSLEILFKTKCLQIQLLYMLTSIMLSLLI